MKSTFSEIVLVSGDGGRGQCAKSQLKKLFNVTITYAELCLTQSISSFQRGLISK